jgi:hypothetical protein
MVAVSVSGSRNTPALLLSPMAPKIRNIDWNAFLPATLGPASSVTLMPAIPAQLISRQRKTSTSRCSRWRAISK